MSKEKQTYKDRSSIAVLAEKILGAQYSFGQILLTIAQVYSCIIAINMTKSHVFLSQKSGYG